MSFLIVGSGLLTLDSINLRLSTADAIGSAVASKTQLGNGNATVSCYPR